MNAGSDPSGEPKTAPLHVAPQSVVPPGSAPSDSCPTCSAQMALDQRYCLNCGNRRGDPRLPFMDAVVYMEASRQPKGAAGAGGGTPPPAAPARSGFSPGTTLIAGIATLILAVGVGFLIGNNSNDSAPVANQKPTVIQVGGNGGGEVEPEAETPSEGTGGKEAGKSAGRSKGSGGTSEGTSKDSAVEEGANGGSKAAQEVLHTAPGVKEAAPEAQVGESCEKGTSGCSESGEFNGNFFGE